MKVRIGITAPLVLDSLEQGQFLWPRLLERNFGIAADFKHSLWIESSAQLSGDPTAVVSAKSDTRPFSLRESLLESGPRNRSAWLWRRECLNCIICTGEVETRRASHVVIGQYGKEATVFGVKEARSAGQGRLRFVPFAARWHGPDFPSAPGFPQAAHRIGLPAA